MSPKNSRTKRTKPVDKTGPGRGQTGGSSDDPNYEGATPSGSGGQGGYNKEGNPLPTKSQQDYEHGKGFPRRKT